MPIETRGTLGKLEFGGYPFGNVTFLSFDVDVSVGDEALIALRAENDTTPSNFLAIDWGDDTANSTQSTASHEYRSGGVFTINIAAQPDFEGVTEGQLRGAIDLSTLDLSGLDDLTDLVLRNNGKGVRLFGTAIDGTCPAGVVGFKVNNNKYANTKGTVPLSILESSIDDLTLISVNVDDALSNLPPATNISFQDCRLGTSQTVAASDLSSNLEVWKMGDVVNITSDDTALAKASAVLVDVKCRRTSTTGSTRKLFASSQQLERYQQGNHDVDRNLSGQVTSSDQVGPNPRSTGEPILPPTVIRITELSTSDGLLYLPDDFSKAGPADGNAISIIRFSAFPGGAVENPQGFFWGSSGGSTPAPDDGLYGALVDGVDLSSLSIQMTIAINNLLLPVRWDAYADVALYGATAPSFVWTSGLVTPRSQPVQILEIRSGPSEIDLDDPNDWIKDFLDNQGATNMNIRIQFESNNGDSWYAIDSYTHSPNGGDITRITLTNDVLTANSNPQTKATSWCKKF